MHNVNGQRSPVEDWLRRIYEDYENKKYHGGVSVDLRILEHWIEPDTSGWMARCSSIYSGWDDRLSCHLVLLVSMSRSERSNGTRGASPIMSSRGTSQRNDVPSISTVMRLSLVIPCTLQ